jgi:hypothetical protein
MQQKNHVLCPVPVAHACNLSYSGDRDQEVCYLKPAWANSSQDPISNRNHKKKKKKKKIGRVAQVVSVPIYQV